MSFSFVKQSNPSDFPLHIYIGKGEDKDMRIVAKIPNSVWIPRIEERLVVPVFNNENKIVASYLLKVELVVHDLAGCIVNIFCKKLKILKNTNPKDSNYTHSITDIWDELEAKIQTRIESNPILHSYNESVDVDVDDELDELESLRRQLDNL